MKTQIQNNNEIQLATLLKQDVYRMDLLKAIHRIKSKELWIAGGFVRNMVWDSLHGYKHRSELGDVDVFYFDIENIEKNEELKLSKKLNRILPNVNWSIKNQARMHLHDNNQQYKNLEDALTKFPDTSSAVAVRLNNLNEIVIIAPFGLEDLFNLVVKPTPSCQQNLLTYKKYKSRQIEKKWTTIWPLLHIEK